MSQLHVIPIYARYVTHHINIYTSYDCYDKIRRGEGEGTWSVTEQNDDKRWRLDGPLNAHIFTHCCLSLTRSCANPHPLWLTITQNGERPLPFRLSLGGGYYHRRLLRPRANGFRPINVRGPIEPGISTNRNTGRLLLQGPCSGTGERDRVSGRLKGYKVQDESEITFFSYLFTFLYENFRSSIFRFQAKMASLSRTGIILVDQRFIDFFFYPSDKFRFCFLKATGVRLPHIEKSGRVRSTRN